MLCGMTPAPVLIFPRPVLRILPDLVKPRLPPIRRPAAKLRALIRLLHETRRQLDRRAAIAIDHHGPARGPIERITRQIGALDGVAETKIRPLALATFLSLAH